MDYTQVTIFIDNTDVSDILIALLSDQGYEGFEEKGASLIASISSVKFTETNLKKVLKPFNLIYSLDVLPKTNWNKEWEENFEPVVVDDFCTVRADFHHIPINTLHDIVITPKMSFGTGHHATTQLMIRAMRELNFIDKTVLDFGTGTGILAILASILGAKVVLAIDNEEWAIDNAIENVERNGVSNVSIVRGSLDVVNRKGHDIILANINRNVLLDHMNDLYNLINENGRILMSGLLVGDRNQIMEAAQRCGLVCMSESSRLKWISLLFKRS